MLKLIAVWSLHLKEAAGINLPFLYDAYYAPLFWHGLLITIELSVVTIIASIAVGIVGAGILRSRSNLIRLLVQGYVELFRNTPPLVQIYFFYFGVSNVLPTLRNSYGLQSPLLNGIEWAMLSLTLYAGAFNVEIFRSGIEAIPHATLEAAEALGYRPLQTYRNIALPLAIRICLPALTNNLVNLVKTTNLAYTIGVPELLYASNQIWSDTGNVPEMMVTLLIIYLLFVGLVVAAMRWLETSLRRPGLGMQ